MCSTNNSSLPGAMIPYGLKIPNPSPFAHFSNSMTHAAFELHRAQAQMYDYNARLRLGLHYAAAAPGHPLAPYSAGPHDPLAYIYGKQDPRTRFLHEEPKPSHSYIGLIAMAILSSKDKKLVLSDIYQWILDNYPYFRTRGPGWRNSIRHNLSLNDCFVKAGRSANGKGHYWAIHAANHDDFKKGDFRRRRAQRKVRKAMGLAVPDEEDSPSPPPTSATIEWQNRVMLNDGNPHSNEDEQESGAGKIAGGSPTLPTVPRYLPNSAPSNSKKRLFDVESLLAPDHDHEHFAKKLRVEAGNSAEPHLNDTSKSDEEDGIIEVDTVGDDEEEAQDLRKIIERGEGERQRSEGPGSPPESPRSLCSDPREASVSPTGSGAGSPPVLRREGPEAGGERGPGLHVGLPIGSWHERPSAFHSTLPTTVTAWSNLHPHAGYPMMNSPYPLHPGASIPNMQESAQKWQEAFSRIMARSAEKNTKLDS